MKSSVPVLELSLAEAFKKISHLSPSNYCGNTPSAGEDASGTLRDALLHEPQCLSFLKNAKIEQQQTS